MKHNMAENLFYVLKFINLRNIINTSIKHFLSQKINKPFLILEKIVEALLWRKLLVGLLSDYTL